MTEDKEATVSRAPAAAAAAGISLDVAVATVLSELEEQITAL